nr:serine/threonine-protein kinase PknK [Leptospiraceae bacterium]
MITLSGYEILNEIYSGEKSLVFRGLKSNKPVIIKILQNEYPSPVELSGFKQEYEVLKKIQTNSSSVVRVLGLEKYKNGLAIIFEDIGGEAISRILVDIQSMPQKEILNILIQSAKALGEIHAAGLVHKDIKSHNIVLNQKTGELQIIDFGNASYLSKQNSYTPLNSSLEGTLAYISPEQTGRMNRTIDYRTDYYSLGVTFYQILTGELPFVSSDPMELVHAHIAKMPTPPIDSGLKPTGQRVGYSLSKVISDIVMKLLQKNPEDRYQSITGLVYDLEWCLANINGTSTPLSDRTSNKVRLVSEAEPPSLQIGQNDFSGKFQIPEKLYGRENEINQIIDTFKMVATGNVELMLISGRSGIGKSALINEVNKPITQYKGYFASGKYDQFKRAIPFHAISQAFQSLIQQVLTSRQEEIVLWKENLLRALGSNGQVIVDIIPELESLIGKQPAVSELGTTESQNRFNLVFQNFIQAFCRKEHPIAIFLDDLQWADNPSISLIQTILSNPEMKYLYLMLSFRDNEVLPTDSFSLMLENLKKTGFSYKEILLEPIGILDITHLVSDTLSCEESKAQELANVLFEKTKGNPFFVNELFTSFYKEDLVYLDSGLAAALPTVLVQWSWDISKIRETKISENVIDLMVEKVQELTPDQIELLKLAACVGDSFSLDTFIQLADKEIDMVNRELTTISNEGFLLLTQNQVRFVHDKVREATYSLISEEERANKHYAIGSTYLRITKEEEVEENVFTIVSQLNQGIIHVVSREEKVNLQKLNILAGNKSFSSTAYEAALEFYKFAISLLAADSWENEYELTLELYTNRARSEYLSKNYDNAQKTFDLVLERTKNILDKIPIYELELSMHTARNQFIDALNLLKKTAKSLGVTLPQKPTELSPLPEIIKFKIKQGKKPIQDLEKLPFMTKPISKGLMQLMNAGVASSFIYQPNLFPVLVLKMVNLSIRDGNFYLSPFAYVAFGLIQGSGLGDFNSGYEFGKLALDLIPKLGDNAKQIECRTNFLFAAMISHWKCHAKEVVPYFQKAIQSGQEYGDLQYLSYSINNQNIQAYFMRENLGSLSEKFQKFLKVMNMLKQHDASLYYGMNFQFIENLRGNSKDIFSISGEHFDEAVTVSEWKNVKNGNTLFTYYTYLSEIHYLSGSFEKAFEYSLLAAPLEGGVFGMM